MIMTKNQNTPDVRWKQRLENLKSAFSELEEACIQDEYSNLELAGLVQTFNFTFELCWKTLKDLLAFEGYEANTPREVIKKAFGLSLIHDVDRWLKSLENRNILSHTYNKATAEWAKNTIKTEYAPMLRECVALLTERAKEE